MTLSRRVLLGSAAAGLLPAAEPVIDIHQHTNYTGRTDAELLQHQRDLGIARTVLLPAGSKYGLAAGAGGNDTVVALARQLPGEFVFFANELPDVPETRSVLERYLRMGAIGIGEQKFPVAADSPAIELVATVAREFRVPVLLHFEHEHYNLGLANFHRILERFPEVNFIGHAQTWWGNIDRKHDPSVLYPKGKVTPGGVTDRFLTDYPNAYGDLSAGSGLNSLLRDEGHATAFLERHQDKLMFGSDCSDRKAYSEQCLGAKILAAVRKLSPSREVTGKILSGNASRVLRLRA